MQRRLAPLCAHVWVGAVLEQQPYRVLSVDRRRPVQRLPAIGVLGHRIGAGPEQQGDDLLGRQLVLAGDVQARRPSIPVAVWVGLQREQLRRLAHVVGLGRKQAAQPCSASWLSGGFSQRRGMPQAARSFGQPRPVSRLVCAGRPTGLISHRRSPWRLRTASALCSACRRQRSAASLRVVRRTGRRRARSATQTSRALLAEQCSPSQQAAPSRPLCCLGLF
eukprot:scaffold84678_cov64-Phaeocystis_antarctica.AAC.2